MVAIIGIVTIIGTVTVLGIATITGMITNDQFMDGGHPWGCLENFDHFGEGDFTRDGDHPKNCDHHRGGDYSRDSGCLWDFYHPKGWLHKFGSIES